MMAIPLDRTKNNQDTPAWEYTTLDLAKPKTDVDGLNRLGREGGEAGSMALLVGRGVALCGPHRSDSGGHSPLTLGNAAPLAPKHVAVRRQR